jgi:hypothetical protein
METKILVLEKALKTLVYLFRFKQKFSPFSLKDCERN